MKRHELEKENTISIKRSFCDRLIANQFLVAKARNEFILLLELNSLKLVQRSGEWSGNKGGALLRVYGC